MHIREHTFNFEDYRSHLFAASFRGAEVLGPCGKWLFQCSVTMTLVTSLPDHV